jgi:histidyl-tRNA synthetase
MRDLLPGDMERFRAVEATFLDVCRAWGYREIRTPTIEYLHLFTAAGTLSPRTLERVYSFLDWDGWSGERVVLRPDATIPAARLYAEALDGGNVVKLCYVENVFQFATGDASREDWQAGVELIGDTGATGDTELVLLGAETLRRLGIEGVTLKVSHAGIVRTLLARTGLSHEEQRSLYQRMLDEDTDVVGELERLMPDLDVPLRLLFDVEGGGSAYVSNLQGALCPTIPELQPPLSELATVVEALEACGLAPRAQAALARRFEYYSGLVFRFEREGRRLGGGGRYDHLIELVHGRPVPASGFAFELGPLMDLVAPSRKDGAAPVFVEPAGPDARSIAAAMQAADELRRRGVTAWVTLDSGVVPAWKLTAGPDGYMLSSWKGANQRHRCRSLNEVEKRLGGGA